MAEKTTEFHTRVLGGKGGTRRRKVNGGPFSPSGTLREDVATAANQRKAALIERIAALQKA